MVQAVIEDEEVRVGVRVIHRKIIRTDDTQCPSGYRYALHYGYVDGRGTILRYDDENQTPGRHERHTEDDISKIEFPVCSNSATDSSAKSTTNHDQQHPQNHV